MGHYSLTVKLVVFIETKTHSERSNVSSSLLRAKGKSFGKENARQKSDDTALRKSLAGTFGAGKFQKEIRIAISC